MYSDINFNNKKLILSHPINNTSDDANNQAYKIDSWTIDSKDILYALIGYEWVEYAGIISADGSNNREYKDELKESRLLSDKNGNLFYYKSIMGPCLEFGLFNKVTDKKTILSPKNNSGFQYPEFSPNGTLIQYANEDSPNHEFYIYDIKLNKIIKTIKTNDLNISSNSFTKDDKYLLFTTNKSSGMGDFPTFLYIVQIKD